jgi:3-isopropylmalate/(R)-2-methylmalate dehydratase small subunit
MSTPTPSSPSSSCKKHRTDIGFGPSTSSDDWRLPGSRAEPGEDCTHRPLNKDFVLNQTRAIAGASILLTRENFGCGSSREHAPWALDGLRLQDVIIAPSFADIFFNNCFKNGILPIVLDPARIDGLFALATGPQALEIEVDLLGQTLTPAGGKAFSFDMDPFHKECLHHGLDDIGLTLNHVDGIRAYEERRRREAPWLFA